MTLKQLVTEICTREGGKHEAMVGDVRSIVGILSDMMFENPSLADVFLKNGKRRAKRVKK